MSLRYSYQLHNALQRLPYAHLLQVEAEEVEAEEVEAEEVEAEEVEAEAVEAEEEEEADKRTPLTSDSAEILPRYSQEKGRKQTASSPNSNATIWPTSESQNLTLGSEKSLSPAPISKAPSLTNGSIER